MIPKASPLSRRHSRCSRSGSAYLLVVMTVLIVTVIGLSAVALSRVELRRSLGAADAAGARAAARAAVEFGLERIRLENNWNNLRNSSPDWAANVPFQGGAYSLTRTAYDATDPNNDRLTLLATGTYGTAIAKFQIVIVGGRWIDPGGWTQVVN